VGEGGWGTGVVAESLDKCVTEVILNTPDTSGHVLFTSICIFMELFTVSDKSHSCQYSVMSFILFEIVGMGRPS